MAILRSGQERLDAIAEALRRRPHYPWALFLGGTHKYVQRKFHEAKKDFDRAIELQPSFASAYMNRGDVLREPGDMRAALADFEASARLRPNDPDKHFVGTMLLQLRDFVIGRCSRRRGIFACGVITHGR